MLTLVIASRNPGKIAEIKNKLKSYPILVKGLDSYPQIPEIVESGNTFRENAIIKAKSVSQWTGFPVLADDSGLEIEYLDQMPGIFSARWGKNDDERICRVLQALKETEEKQRNAKFVCVMSLLTSKQQIYITTGICPGKITLKPKGNNGFGYDPIFIPQGHLKTFAQLSPAMKNSISHRAIALKKMIHIIIEHYQLL